MHRERIKLGRRYRRSSLNPHQHDLRVYKWFQNELDICNLPGSSPLSSDSVGASNETWKINTLTD